MRSVVFGGRIGFPGFLVAASVFLPIMVLDSVAVAQLCSPSWAPMTQPTKSFRLTPQTVVEPQEVTVYKEVEESSVQKRQVTELKPVVRTETRERRSTVLKPVIETEMKTERYSVFEPVTETSYETRQRQVTEYVEETHYREEQVVVPKVVQQTQYQDRQTVVRRPVVETQYRQTPVTSMVPVTQYRPQLVDQGVVVNQLVTQPGYDRNRLQFLPRTTYTDPVTMQQVYRRPGLYWTNQGQPATASLVPTYVPNYQIQQVQQTAIVPQTTLQTEAVQVTRYVDEVVTEKVPVTSQVVQNEVVTQRIPYVVRTPITKIVEETVPVQRTTQQERVMERQVPVQRTVMQRVETVEPYEVQVREMVPETRTEDVPVTQRRLMPSKEVRNLPRTVWVREELDLWGNPIPGTAVAVGGSMYREATPSTTATGQPALQATGVEGTSLANSSTLGQASNAGSSTADQTPVMRSLKPYLSDVPDLRMSPSQPELRPIQTGPKPAENSNSSADGGTATRIST
ncbi:MAG: hypothetical protein JNL67_12930 [Planctomycetaceae bacterium]|nr:hypothetical protein [Planctomycetaceae bacterium]